MALSPIPVHEPQFFQNLKIPPLPKAIADVYAAVQAGKGPHEVAPLIAKDVAFSAHILRMVNSAYYALPAPVSNVRMAVAYLGLGEVARMALALSVVDTLAPPDKGMVRRFWLHGYYTALIAKHLARRLRPRVAEVDDLYAAALLHDLGQLVYARCFPAHSKVLLEEAKRDGIPLSEAERRHDLPTSARLGTMVADHWRLSPTIRRACEVSDRPLSELEPWPKPEALDLLVVVSHHLAGLASEELSPDHKDQIAAEVRRVLGEDEDQFLLLMGDVYELKLKAESAVAAML